MSVASHICAQLADWGIDRIFGVSGANIELVFEAAVRHRTLDPVLSKHEAAAAMMAIGWQERSGLPGVVATTSGGASFNIVAPLAEALDSEIPLLALVGQSPSNRDGTGAFQDSSGAGTRVDAQQILGAASVRCERVTDARRIPAALSEAVRAAIYDRGPVVLLLPRNVQSDACADQLLPLPTEARRGAAGAPVPPLLARRLNAAIGGAVAPLVIAGRGVLAAEARSEFLRLADAWGAAIAVAPDAKSAVPSGHPRLLGVAGVMGHHEVLDYAARAPVCVLAGTRLPDVSAYGLSSALAQATLVSLNERPCFPGLAGHRDIHELPGPLARNLAALRRATAAAAAARASQPPFIPPPAGGAAGPLRAGAAGDEDAISAELAMLMLGDHLEHGSDVLIDAGNAGAFAIHHLPSDGEGMRSVALGMGAMGHAFGAAIGACEFTHRRTYVVAGDGAFYMHGMEIHTAIERRLPITFVVINNNAHAMCSLREQRLLGGATDLNVFAPARLGDGVRAMFPSLEAAEVGSAGELERALSQGRACEGPYLISVTTAADEQPPFWPLADRPMTGTKRRQEIAA